MSPFVPPAGPKSLLFDETLAVAPLKKTVERIVRQHGHGMGSVGDFREIALKFLRNPTSVKKGRLWVVFQYLYMPFKEMGGQRIADDPQRLNILLDRFQREFSKESALQPLYFKMLMNGYFTHGRLDVIRPEVERRLVRETLTAVISQLPVGRFEPQWLNTTRKYKGLLSSDACIDLAPIIRFGDPNAVNEILAELELPEGDWLRELLVLRTIDELTSDDLGDDVFKFNVDRVIELANFKYAYYAIPKLLNRYYRCSNRNAHMGLANYVTRHWGSVYDNNAGAWSAVSKEVRQMVRIWLNNKFLEVFFQHFGTGMDVDKERLDFMKLFLHQVDFIKIALHDNDRIRIRRNDEIWKLKTEYQSNFGLIEKSNATALIVSVNNLIWVEFLGHSNAAYIYEESACRFKISSNLFYGDTSYSGLKYGYPNHQYVDRVVHNQGWQSKLIPTLRRHGLEPITNPYNRSYSNTAYRRY